MHSFFQKNKKFIIVYSIVVFVIALALITLSLLGNIEREGYLSEFSYNGYVYSFKINYYDKIFKNSDIYDYCFRTKNELTSLGVFKI